MFISATFTCVFASNKVVSTECTRGDDFSAKINLNLDNDTVSPGGQFNITLSIDNISKANQTDFSIMGWTYATYNEYTAYKKVLTGFPTASPAVEGIKNSALGSRQANFSPDSDTSSIKLTDVKATLTFTVKSEEELSTAGITLPTTLTFSHAVLLNSYASTDKVAFDPIEITITDTATPTEATYTVSAKPSVESAYVDDTFNVDVVASANQTADLAAVDAVLNYDKDLVKPTAVETKNLTKGEALYYTDGTNGVTTEGQGKIATYGDTASVGTDGLVVATYTFEALKAGTATFSIADGAKVGKSGETAEFAATSAAAASVEIKEVPDEKILISNDVYKGAPTGKQVLKYISKNMPAEGSAYFYGDDTAPLYYAGDNDKGKHVFLGFVDSTLTLDTLGTVSEKTGTYETLAYDGDLNVTGSVNAIDALIAYDLSNSIYAADTDMSKLSAKARLNADINKDGAVTAADARAILYKGLGINDPSKTN